MKKFTICLAMAAVALAACACSDTDTPAVPVPAPAVPVEKETGFARGADVSWLTQQEAEGYKFYTPGADRRPMECMELLRDHCGVNAIRLRVWVNPADGRNGKADVVAKARRAEALGLRTMIDFHFSDTWADPGHQEMPEAWKALPEAELPAAVAAHVTDVLTALRDAGVTPEWVQVGNETTPGMMLPAGDIDKNPAGYVALNNAGYDAVKSVFPEAKVIVHLDNGHDRWRYDRMFGALEAGGGRYDMIGMSLYPWWEGEHSGRGWEAVADDCIANIRYVKQRYGRPVMICEIGMPYTRAEACRDLIAKMMQAPVEGIFYWEPQAPAGYNGGYDMGCFDGGAPTVALDAFKKK